MKPRLALALLTGLTAAAAAPAHAQRVEAGLLDSLAGPPGAVRVLRDGVSLPVGRLSPLYAGDSLLAQGAGALARVRLYGRADAWVCGTPAPRPDCRGGLRLSQPRAGAGLGQGIKSLVHSVLGPLLGGEQWSRTVTTSARGDNEIALPLLATPQEIAAGTRDLELVWRGGRAPYSVRLLQDGAGLVAEIPAAAGTGATLRGIPLTPGDYALRVGDAAGTASLVRFRVVKTSALPQPPKAYRSKELGGGATALLGAAWLAGRPEASWLWEAYLRLGGLADDPIAQRMRRELLAGRLPPPGPGGP